MRVVFLGTNGWYSSQSGNTVCIFVDIHDYILIFDAGNGIHRLDEYADFNKPAFLFLSHFHFDHTSGIHILGKFNFKNGLTICGPKGIKHAFNTFFKSPYTAGLDELPYNTKVIELPDENNGLPFNLKTLPLSHSDICIGFRLNIEGKVFTYVSDTGYCENAVKLAENADLLVTECALLPGEEQPDWPHLNPNSAAQIAAQAKARSLILTHFEAVKYKTREDRKNAQAQARKIFKQTRASFDLMEIDLE